MKLRRDRWSSRAEPRRVYLVEYSHNIDTKDVINQMIGGVDICLVDPRLYPLLEPTLQDYMEAFRAQKDAYNMKKIQFYMEYIREEPIRADAERLLSMRVRTAPPKMPVLSPEEVSTEVDFILRSETFRAYPEDELELILEGLRQRRRECIDAKNYLGASRAEHFAKVVLSHGQLSEVATLQEDKCQFYETLLSEEREKLQILQARWQELYANMEQSAREDMLQMKTDYESSLAELNGLRNQPPCVEIHKYSAELLQLRRREQAMVQSRQFGNAARLKEIGDELQAREDEVIHNRWMGEIDQRIEKIRFTHLKKLQGRKAFWKSERRQLVDQANKETNLAQRTIEHLEKTLLDTQNAKSVTSDLIEQNEGKQSLLPVISSRISERERSTVHGQRRILNHKIYTRTPGSNLRNFRQSRSSYGTRSPASEAT
jgi:hypothetical protein